MEFSFSDFEKLQCEEFSEKHAEGIAKMWGDSDADWPGGFTSGMEFNAQNLLRAYEQIKCACRFVLYDEEQKLVAAMMEYLEIPGKPQATYVGINVHPSYRGGAMFLLAKIFEYSLDKVCEQGYHSMEMETWPTNYPIVSVCKRTGFFWVPDTNVKMVSYLPLLLTTPLILKFFCKNDFIECQYDWALNLNVQMQEDKIIWNNKEVFIYEWKKNKDKIKTIIDLQSENITAFENNDFAICCYIEDSPECFYGEEKTVVWEIENKTEKPLLFSLATDFDKEIIFDKTVPYKAIKEMPITEKMQVSLSMRKPDAFFIEGKKKILKKIKIAENQETEIFPKVYSKVFINDDLLELQTSLNVKNIFSIAVFPELPNFKVNKETEIFLNLHNNSQNVKIFTLNLFLEGNACFINKANEKVKTLNFNNITIENASGIPLKIYGNAEGAFNLKGILHFPSSSQSFLFHFRVLKENSFTYSNEENEFVAENNFHLLKINKQTASLEIFDKYFNTISFSQTFGETGPPFSLVGESPTFYEKEDYAYNHFINEENNLEIIIKKFDKKKHLVIKKHIVYNNSSLIKINYNFLNTTQNLTSFKFQIKTKILRSNSIINLPLKKGLIREPLISRDFPSANYDLTANPKDYNQNWVAYENNPTVVAYFWQDAEVIDFGGNKAPYLTFNITDIHPFSSFSIPAQVFYLGNGNYETIQKQYEDFYAVKEINEEKLKPINLLNIKLFPTLICKDNFNLKIHLENLRGKNLQGNLKMSLNDNFTPSEINFNFDKLNFNNPLTKEFKLKIKNLSCGVSEIKATIDTQFFLKELSCDLIIAGNEKEKINILEEKEQNLNSLLVDNKNFTFKVCGDFCGSLYSLKKEGKEHLLSGFPKSENFSFFTPWFGGIYPICMEELNLPGKLFAEKFNQEKIQKNDIYGNIWEGIKISANLKDPRFKGLFLEVNYLTLPASEIIAVDYKIKNNGTAFQKAFAGFALFLQVGEKAEENILHFLREGNKIRKKTIYDAWTTSQQWASIQNPDTKDILSVITPNLKTTLLVADLGIAGSHFFVGEKINLKPRQENQNLFFVVLNNSLETAKKYITLKEEEKLFYE